MGQVLEGWTSRPPFYAEYVTGFDLLTIADTTYKISYMVITLNPRL